MVRKSFAFILLLTVVLACSLFQPPAARTPSVTTGPAETEAVAASETEGAGEPARPQVTPTPLNVEVDAGLDLEAYTPGQPFTVRFNQPMDTASAQPALLTYPWTPGELRWEAENTQVTFIPERGFQPGRAYTIFVNGSLRAASGAVFTQPPQWQLVVPPAPQVVAHQPAKTDIVTRRLEIQVTFERAMDPESVARALQVQPEVSYSLRWEGETLWIELEEPLNPGTRYRFTVGAEAQDTLGVPLGADYRWVYHLPELVAEVAGPDEEYPNQALIIRCNYPLDVDVLQGKLRVSTPSQPDVPGEWNFVSETQLTAKLPPGGGL